jgi:hypothetical protein
VHASVLRNGCRDGPDGAVKVDVGPAHRRDLATTLSREDQQLYGRPERIPNLFRDFPERRKLAI